MCHPRSMIAVLSIAIRSILTRRVAVTQIFSGSSRKRSLIEFRRACSSYSQAAILCLLESYLTHGLLLFPNCLPQRQNSADFNLVCSLKPTSPYSLLWIKTALFSYHYQSTTSKVSLTNGYHGSCPTIYCVIASLAAVTYWTSAELLVQVYLTFKRKGLYFWSIVVTTAGIVIYTTTILLINFENSNSQVVVVAMLNVGWVISVSAYPVVLWSRLHLVIGHRPRLLKCLLVFIIVISIAFTTLTTAIAYGLTYKYPESWRVGKAIEQVEAFVLTFQEMFTSGLYIYYTAKFLGSGCSNHTHRIIGTLAVVQIVCFSFDLLQIILLMMNRVRLASVLLGPTQAVKLRLEFIVLNQLRTLIKRGLAPGLSLPSRSPARQDDLPQTPASEGARDQKAESSVTSTHSGLMSSTNADMVTLVGSPTMTENCKQKVELSEMDQIRQSHVYELSAGSAKEKDAVDDLEAQYLGRWNGSMSA
ncbi:hypothetical protein EJ08DRAFT_522855 [Tothia fuscella]|uniref:DUF7703 domain-containing protein n=1 Tax=Tothia fuscella TaxID=1048955 RepID=A0A9P4NGZ0_9PEZI|nr:hypothetical protein EJ08DRAFT_522855 [Tothia fuscella]